MLFSIVFFRVYLRNMFLIKKKKTMAPLRISNYEFRISNLEFWNWNPKFRILKLKFQIPNFKFRIPKSEDRSLKSKIKNPKSKPTNGNAHEQKNYVINKHSIYSAFDMVCKSNWYRPRSPPHLFKLTIILDNLKLASTCSSRKLDSRKSHK